MMESWRPVVGFEELYAVSDAGRVRRANGRLIPLHENNGYLYAAFSKDKRSYRYGVHRLVLLAFIGPAPKGMIGLHTNDDRLDNRLDNLRWGTYRENIEDAKRNGRWRKMDDAFVREIRSSPLSDAQIAKAHNLSEMAVFNARAGQTYRHVV